MGKKVAIINGSQDYEHLFIDNGWVVVYNTNDADLVVFTGGEDVTPSLYNHEKHRTTYNSFKRDREEMSVLLTIPDGVPCVGICRGAQFLNVMAGGEMYQDVSGHTRSHQITDATTGEHIFCTSTHHQMMEPSSEAVLVASSALGGTRTWWDNSDNGWPEAFLTEVSDIDYEVVFYPEEKFLCFQPHPEMAQQYPPYERMRSYFFECINKYLGV